MLSISLAYPPVEGSGGRFKMVLLLIFIFLFGGVLFLWLAQVLALKKVGAPNIWAARFVTATNPTLFAGL